MPLALRRFSFSRPPALLPRVSSPAPSNNLDDDTGEKAASPPRCLNCEAVLSGPYCAHCGQHDVDYHRSFYHLTHDLLENLFHFDGKFLVSVAWLLAKPGRLTNEFNAGRRQSQIHPLRFYIFATVLFFLGVHLLNHGHLFDFDRRAADKLSVKLQDAERSRSNADGSLTAAQAAEINRLVTNAVTASGGQLDDKQVAEITGKIGQAAAKVSAAAATPEVDGNTSADRRAKKRSGIRLDQNSGIGLALQEKFVSGELTFSKIIDAIEGNVPTLLFLGMPVFALLLKLLYLGSGRFYIEHLIFSIHLHTWAFLVIMISDGYFKLSQLGPKILTPIFASAVAVWVIWYVFAAFKAVYGQSWTRTGVKLGVLALGYGTALVALAVLLIFWTLAWLAWA
jgi:hypothetical protein